MTMMRRAVWLAAVAAPLALGGCDMMDGGAPAPASPSEVGGANPMAVSGQAGAGTQNGPSGGAEGGATQAGVGIGGVVGQGAGPAAGGPGDNSNTGAAAGGATGGAP